jgi:hypothetical protein
MKAIIFIYFAVVLAGCSSQSASDARWNDMFVDIALRHKFERYNCGCHPPEGFSKENSNRVSHVAKPAPPVKTEQAIVSAPSQPDQVRELSQKIDVLEEALTRNASATNQNQELIVQEIKTLKSQMAELQSKSVVLQPTPPPSNE